MIVVADGEGDIDGIARQERGLQQALGHVPAESIESDFALKVGSQWWLLSFE
jgi:hypothetical protein